jgi:NAD(P)-dependent dehydrogenase (short-subunit alcohol dehydrogenase family)
MMANGANRRRGHDLAGEVAIVTGASRGLGLLLARELSRRSCPVVICARDRAELDRAAAELRSGGAEVTAVACDVTSPDAPQQLVDTAMQRYGRLDILVSNAGLIRVGPVESTSPADYETAWRTMGLAPIRLALAALPVMRRQGHGRIVTITSIGGKVGVPHLLPYSAAKFAAVGFSEGLRAELGAGEVTVTTVVPGLMRTGSHVQAFFGGRRDQEFTWFSLAAGLPVLSMDAERAARRIVESVRAGKPEVILTPLGHLTQRLLLPPAARGSRQAEPGRKLRPAIPRPVFDRLTAFGRAAERRFNQTAAPAPTGQRRTR